MSSLLWVFGHLMAIQQTFFSFMRNSFSFFLF
ncbi:hypothetical protein BpOF4_02585 [Alkalihalophilus pseudofirmus OF4]|uniref:Uncharacterized protein n=1 Tax=Alkalihalophilus pseudofirmus (strain ATCC BAA-2126 / JCM 17055 / OF4) TaxID=398511 RepID=D3FW52_ALKPO|nr:hypothetical protein BpOF4_02585 [Alkalihalophilus pseudofirmus OF4]